MVETAILPSREQLEAFGAQSHGDGPVRMLNLLKYRDSADYCGFPDEVACSGRQAYRRYMQAVVPCLAAVGGRLIMSGPVGATVIGPADEVWDDMLLVEYPGPHALIAMQGSDAYRAIGHHRSAALENSRLIAIGNGQLTCEQ